MIDPPAHFALSRVGRWFVAGRYCTVIDCMLCFSVVWRPRAADGVSITNERHVYIYTQSNVTHSDGVFARVRLLLVTSQEK